MYSWLENISNHFTDWLGSGIGSFFQWLFGGLIDVLTKVIEAGSVVWDLLDTVWDLFIGFRLLIMDLLLLFFPFIPPEVTAVISWGMFAGLIFGIVKLIQKVT